MALDSKNCMRSRRRQESHRQRAELKKKATELRLMAELKIAQGVLSDQPNPIMVLQPRRIIY
jgi:hypothetical protein